MVQTVNYGFEKPSTTKNVDEEFYQLQETLDSVDATIKMVEDKADGKAALSHTHAIADVTGLVSELAAKMPANQTFSLDSLTDVDGAGAAAVGQILWKQSTGWVPSSPLAALGEHEHSTDEVQGLVEALNNRLRVDAAQSLTAAQQGRAWANIGGSRDNDDLIINGCFDVAQRGESQTTNGYGSVDRYIASFSGGAVTTSRQSFTVGDTIGSNVKPFFARQVVGGQSSGAHYALHQQRIEDVRSYAGQTITYIEWFRRSSGSGDLAIELVQNFGTGGSPSAEVTAIGAQKATLSTLWQPFAFTVDVPSIAGKTLGTNGNSFLAVNVWTSAGSDFSARAASLGLQTIGVDRFGGHIRKGVVPVEAANYYSPPTIWETEPACQRYYVSLPSAAEFRGDCTFGSFYATSVSLPPMRRNPDVSLVDDLLFGFPSPTVGAVRRQSVRVEAQCNSTGTGRFFIASVFADAEL